MQIEAPAQAKATAQFQAPVIFFAFFFPQAKPQQLGRENPSYWLARPVATTLSSKYKRRKLQSEGNRDGRTQGDGESVRCLLSSFLANNLVQTGRGLWRKQRHVCLHRPGKNRELFIVL